VGGNVGLDVFITNTSLPLTIGGVDTPLIQRIPIVASNTEYSFSISSATKKVQFRAVAKGKVKYSFISGQSGTNFITVAKGKTEIINELALTGSLTVYFQSDTASEVLEVLSWS